MTLTFGYTEICAREASGGGAGFVSTRLNVPVPCTVSKLTVYTRDRNEGIIHAKGAIYTVDGVDPTNPDVIIGVTDVTDVSELGWYDLVFATPVVVNISQCFLHVTWDGNGTWYVDDDIAGWIGCWGFGYTVASPYPAHNDDVDIRPSVYATYTAVGATLKVTRVRVLGI